MTVIKFINPGYKLLPRGALRLPPIITPLATLHKSPQESSLPISSNPHGPNSAGIQHRWTQMKSTRAGSASPASQCRITPGCCITGLMRRQLDGLKSSNTDLLQRQTRMNVWAPTLCHRHPDVSNGALSQEMVIT